MTQTLPALQIPSCFQRLQRDLIRAMEADGWTGRLSANSHMIMRAPDGVTTCSVAPKPGSTRGAKNFAAPYKRWKRQQADQA